MVTEVKNKMGRPPVPQSMGELGATSIALDRQTKSQFILLARKTGLPLYVYMRELSKLAPVIPPEAMVTVKRGNVLERILQAVEGALNKAEGPLNKVAHMEAVPFMLFAYGLDRMLQRIAPGTRPDCNPADKEVIEAKAYALLSLAQRLSGPDLETFKNELQRSLDDLIRRAEEELKKSSPAQGSNATT